jgi:hypothetical protein
MTAKATATRNEHARTQKALQTLGTEHGTTAPKTLGPEPGIQQGAHGLPFRQSGGLRHSLHPSSTHKRPLTASFVQSEEAAKGLDVEPIRRI